MCFLFTLIAKRYASSLSSLVVLSCVVVGLATATATTRFSLRFFFLFVIFRMWKKMLLYCVVLLCVEEMLTMLLNCTHNRARRKTTRHCFFHHDVIDHSSRMSCVYVCSSTMKKFAELAHLRTCNLSCIMSHLFHRLNAIEILRQRKDPIFEMGKTHLNSTYFARVIYSQDTYVCNLHDLNANVLARTFHSVFAWH